MNRLNRRHVVAATVLGTAAVFLASACGPSDAASDAAGTGKPSAPAGSTASSSTTGATQQPAASATTDAPAQPVGKAGGTTGSTSGGTTSGSSTTGGTGTSQRPIRTQTLPDGSKAAIYQLGDEHYRADVTANGEPFVTLETHGHDAGIDANDEFIVLSLDGQLHAWMGGDNQGPGTFKVAGDWTVKVTKVGELHFRAQVIGNDGAVDATIDADQQDVGLDANGVYIVLSDGGVLSAHE
ncbi:hypothetical protein [Streptomyces sp. CA2R106]|uniref:hypothetical protein n=1 Tax=Streptomyces sp. CA2R106 TaxID=3120153 RepID=UPI00300BA3F3